MCFHQLVGLCQHTTTDFNTENRVARIVSPHPDDAALSVANHITHYYGEAHMLSVFTRSNSHILPGINNNVETITEMRRLEDEAFCSFLGWNLVRATLPDSEVRGIAWNDVHAPISQAIIEQVTNEVTNFTCGAGFDLYIPAGIGLHPDHYAIVRAIGALLKKIDAPIYVYADIPYALNDQPATHRGNIFLGTPINTEHNPGMKALLLSYYPSQISAELLARVASQDNERVWRVDPAYFTQARLCNNDGRTQLFARPEWAAGIAESYTNPHMHHIDVEIEGQDTIPVTIQTLTLADSTTFKAMRLRSSLATDYSRAPTRPEFDRLRKIAAAEAADVIWLSNMPEDAIPNDLIGELEYRQNEAFSNNSSTGIACAPTFDDWLGELSRNTRRVLKRKMARIDAYAESHGEPLQHTYEQLNAANLAAFLDMQRKRAESHTDLHAFQDDQQFTDLLTYIAKSHILHVSNLFISNTRIAMSIIHFDQETKTLSILAQAFNPEWHNYSPGIVNMVNIIKTAHDDNYAYVDLLRGDEEYKTHLVNMSRRLIKYVESVHIMSEEQYLKILNYIKEYEE